MTDKEKLKTILEHMQVRYKSHAEQEKNAAGGRFHAAKADECREIITFIESLHEVTVSEDLEEAATTFADVHVFATRKVCFKAGAHWKKDQFIEKASKFIRTPNVYVVDFNKNGGATTNYEATVEKFKKVYGE